MKFTKASVFFSSKRVDYFCEAEETFKVKTTGNGRFSSGEFCCISHKIINFDDDKSSSGRGYYGQNKKGV
jgi:hypothetical protein